MAKTAREWSKEFREKNPGYQEAYGKQWFINHPSYMKKNHVLWRYGISREQYNEMFSMQKGKCSICSRHQEDFKRAFFVDHDHITGKVRGLICVNCNTVLGHAKDSIDILKNAIKYLIKNSK